MTQLTKPVKRQIKVHGVEAPINLTISEEGLSMQVAGMKLKISADWVSIANALHTPVNVPSFLEGNPIKMLSHQATEKAKKAAKKAAKSNG